ncbi:hypothetical protein, partial [Acetobacter lambici]|uniref:hypothetical protein n=1 Tax=Acetobacter lambici TaxID=1332824 RepID=UPI001A7E7353
DLLPLVLEQVDRLTRQRLIHTEVTGDGLRHILSTARYSPASLSGCPLPGTGYGVAWQARSHQNG